MPIQFNSTGVGTAGLGPATSGSWTFTMPTADGTSGQFVGTNGAGAWTFQTASAPTTTGTSFASNTTGANATVNNFSATPTGGTTQVAMALVPKGTGGIYAAVPDGTAVGGNARGQYVWDMQIARTAADQVAACNYGTILGGANNKMDNFSTNYTICGGANNVITGNSTGAVVCGGNGNSIQNSYMAVVLNGLNGSCGTGSGSSNYSSILTGRYNSTNSQSYTTAFPTYNNAQSFYGCCTYLNTRLGGFSSTLTTIPLTTYNGSVVIDSTNSIRVENSSTVVFDGVVIATAGNAGNTKTWLVEGVAVRANGSNVSLSTSSATASQASAGASAWTLTITADTTNQCVVFTVASATNVSVVASINQTRIRG